MGKNQTAKTDPGHLIHTLVQQGYGQERIANLLRHMSSEEIGMLDSVVRYDPWYSDGWLPHKSGKAYIPHPGQEAFHRSTARFRALISGRGAGKTASGIQEGLIRVRKGLNGIILGPDLRHFRRSTWTEIEDWIPWNHVKQHHKADMWIRFDNGGVIYYGGIEDPDSWRGPNVNWLWFDEAARKPTDAAWKVAIGSVRIGPNPGAWITTTPRGKHHWVHKYFVEKHTPEDVRMMLAEIGWKGELYDWASASLHDNKANLDPMYFASMLASYTGSWRDQEVYGKFIERISTMFDRDWFRLISPMEIPICKHWVRYWDLATTEPSRHAVSDEPDESRADWTCSYLMGMSDGGHIIVASERRFRKSWPEVKEEIVRQALLDGPHVVVATERQGFQKAAWQDVVSDIRLASHAVTYLRIGRWSGSKEERARPIASRAHDGLILLLDGGWVDDFLDEFEAFPDSAFDDRVDAVTGGMGVLAQLGQYDDQPSEAPMHSLGLDVRWRESPYVYEPDFPEVEYVKL